MLLKRQQGNPDFPSCSVLLALVEKAHRASLSELAMRAGKPAVLFLLPRCCLQYIAYIAQEHECKCCAHSDSHTVQEKPCASFSVHI